MMMRQTKTTITTWSVAGILVAGLLMFGCKRQAGHMEQGERGLGAPHEDGGHGHDDSGMAESMRATELTGKLSDGVRVIELKARKFAFEPATVIVKQGEKIRLRVTSEDVMHGIGIADYDIDRKLPPNETQVIEFTVGNAGRHHFHCSVFCGSGHGDMHGELVVLP
jgi:cytochrome c oxidase subunit 2